ncbi:hypothetical protein GCM10020000_01890 [Streptomyces olivoverticillatus]
MLTTQELPHSLGLVYEELTAHLGFLRSSDEYKVMALAAYGKPRFLPQLREYVHATGDGGFRAHAVPWAEMTAPGPWARTGARTTRTWPQAPRPAWKRSCWTSRCGCTAAPAPPRWPWRAASP